MPTTRLYRKNTVSISSKQFNFQSNEEFMIKIADDLEDKLQAFQLIYQNYIELGYINSNPFKVLLSEYDFLGESVIFVVKNKSNQVVACTSLLFDRKGFEIPAQKFFCNSYHSRMMMNRNIAEVTKLVTCKKLSEPNRVLLMLFNSIYIYTRMVRGYNEFLLQVDPKYKGFYQKYFGAKCIGDVVKNSMINDHPVVLLSIDFDYVAKHYREKPNDRSIPKAYRHFVYGENENIIAVSLSQSGRTISREQKNYLRGILIAIENS